MNRTKSKKYTGVYLNELVNGDISYSFTYKDLYNRTKWITVGKKSAGITEAYVYRKRNQTISQVQLGEDPEVVKKKKKIKVTLNEIAHKYFTAKEGINRDNARQKRKYEFHIQKKLGNRDIASISRSDINALRQGVIKLGRAPKTVNSIIQLLSAIYNHNIREEGLKIDNPCTSVKPLHSDDHRQRFLTTDEVHLLLKMISSNMDAYLFVKLALSTGARKGGIMNIQKKDIDFSQNNVSIYDFKRGNTYTGFFNDEIRDILLETCKHLGANDYVIGRGSEPWHRKKIERVLRPVMNKLFNKGLGTT